MIEDRINTASFAALPKLGEQLDGAEFRGILTKPDGTHVAVVFLGISEQDADQPGLVEWAKSRGGELASRVVMQLLIASMTLPVGWYHTSELYDASTAWLFGSSGRTTLDYRGAGGAGVAVRLIPLVA